MAEQKHCMNCGQELGEGARFCASCGSPAGAGEENVIGIVAGIHRKKGMFKSETFNILVTDRRLVFALLTNDIIKEQAAALKGQGFMARMAGTLSGEYITRRYQDMPPEQALQENPDNFAIPVAEINKVKISAGMSNPDSVHDADGKLEIRTSGDKFTFVLPDGSQSAARAAFRTAGLI